MIIVDLYPLAGFIVAILALFMLKPNFGGFGTSLVMFLLMMFFWPVTAAVILIHELDKRNV